MKRCSPEKAVDEIILNPKSLQKSRLNLRHSSQVIWGHNVFAFLICSGLCTRSSRMKYPSDSLLWIFCSPASKQKAVIQSELLQSASAENQYLIKARSKDKDKKKKRKKKYLLPEAFLYLFFFFIYKQYCLFMPVSFFLPSHWYPPSLIYPVCAVKCTDTLPVRPDSGRSFDLKMTSLLGLTNVI